MKRLILGTILGGLLGWAVLQSAQASDHIWWLTARDAQTGAMMSLRIDEHDTSELNKRLCIKELKEAAGRLKDAGFEDRVILTCKQHAPK